MLAHNRAFVSARAGSVPPRDAGPAALRRVVVVSCMDTRLTHLLPAALGLRENEAKHVKNAGAVITHPFGGIMRSIMVAIFALDADEVFVVGHHDCGMTRVEPRALLASMRAKGIARATLVTLQYAGVDVARWLAGFASVEASVRNSVDVIRNHPLTPIHVPVHGLLIDPHTGELTCIVDGYGAQPVLTGGAPAPASEQRSSSLQGGEWLASSSESSPPPCS